jgi:hypothetical protein
LTRPHPSFNCTRWALMAELVDALLSGSSAARRGGSSPLQGTISFVSRTKGAPTGRRTSAGSQSALRAMLDVSPALGAHRRGGARAQAGFELSISGHYALGLPLCFLRAIDN